MSKSRGSVWAVWTWGPGLGITKQRCLLIVMESSRGKTCGTMCVVTPSASLIKAAQGRARQSWGEGVPMGVCCLYSVWGGGQLMMMMRWRWWYPTLVLRWWLWWCWWYLTYLLLLPIHFPADPWPPSRSCCLWLGILLATHRLCCPSKRIFICTQYHFLLSTLFLHGSCLGWSLLNFLS